MSSRKGSNNSSSKKEKKPGPTRVIVIGAGMSGLACARELQRRRYDVLVVEARSRVGGRVWGTSMETAAAATANDPLLVDLGGALIHGTLGNPLSQICVQLGIATSDHLAECLLLDSNGWPVDAKQDEKMSQIFNQSLEDTFEAIQKLKNAKGKTEASEVRKTEASEVRNTEASEVRKTEASEVRKTEAQLTEPLAPEPPSTEPPAIDTPKKEASTTEAGNAKAQPEEAANTNAQPTPASSTSTAIHNGGGSDQSEPSPLEDFEDNFGHLFDKIATEQFGTTLVGSALWNWQQANLELSCGTSFDNLGFTWNDDEAYGFEGAHVALRDSWKPVVEALAEPLNIAFDCPVVEIEVAEGDGTFRGPSPRRGAANAPLELEAGRAPSRKSRRLLQGDGAAGVRRSSRTPRQVQAFTVSSHAALSYDDLALDYSAHKAKRKRDPPKVRVTLQNGTILQADAVVCTLPLGVLKTNAVTFIPELPQAKRDAIQQLGCGLLNKCVLSFDHVFWQDSDFFGLAGEETPFLILNGHKITGKPLLIFMFGGESAFDVDQDWTDADLVAECMTVLKKISKRIPPEPLDYIVTRWGQDAYARMSFSYVPPKVHGSEALATMSEPVVSSYHEGRPLILFAGEHTTPFHPSTIHGAFLSGIREAYRLDLNLEPRLNNGLAFDPSFLYQRTFRLKKKKDAGGGGPGPSQAVIDGAAGRTSSTSISSSAAARKEEAAQANQQSRGRRQGVMSLRKKKGPSRSNNAAVVHSPTRHSARKAPPAALLEGASAGAAAPLEPCRKSARKLKSPLPYRDEEDADAVTLEQTAASEQNGHHQRSLATQEERTLERLVQAYPNWHVIQSKVLPLYGGTTKKVSALKQRYQQIRRSARRSDKSMISDWKVAGVGQAKPKEHQSPPQEGEAEGGERKSKRKAAARSVLDL